jgi:3-methyladenine DNA glycosylase AlkD
MKYFPANPPIDKLIEKIRKSIHLGMNGITTESMERAGIYYKLNYGVSIPQLKQIAARYEQNHELAQRLWALKVRETMILACLLQPIDSFTDILAEEWVNDCNNTELIEQTCMHLFSKLSNAPEKAIEWINSKTKHVCLCGFTLAARIANAFTDKQAESIIKKALESVNNEDFMTYNVLAICLRNMTRRSLLCANQIAHQIQQLDSKQMSCRHIYQEVKTDIHFFYNIEI